MAIKSVLTGPRSSFTASSGFNIAPPAIYSHHTRLDWLALLNSSAVLNSDIDHMIMSASSILNAMDFRRYTAIQPHCHPIGPNPHSPKLGDLKYQLKYERGDKILVCVDSLDLDYPIGINESDSQIGRISSLNHLGLDPDAGNTHTTRVRIHGIITHTALSRGYLDESVFQCHRNSEVSEGRSSLNHPFFIFPDQNGQARGRPGQPSHPQTLRTEPSIPLFDLHTAEPASVPISYVQLFPSHRYIGSTPLNDSNFPGPAIIPQEPIVATKLNQRAILVDNGKRSINVAYCIDPKTGATAWVLQKQLEPLGEDFLKAFLKAFQETSTWSTGTITNKRYLKKPVRTTPLPEEAPEEAGADRNTRADRYSLGDADCGEIGYENNGSDGEGSDYDYEEFDTENQRLDSCPSPEPVCGDEFDGDCPGPLRIQQENLIIDHELCNRVSITKNQCQSREKRDIAMRNNWYRERRGNTKQHCMYRRHHQVPGASVIWRQFDTEE